MELIDRNEIISELQACCRIRLAEKRCNGKCGDCNVDFCISKIEQANEYVCSIQVEFKRKE